jgi:acyl-CoA dehydrogenase
MSDDLTLLTETAEQLFREQSTPEVVNKAEADGGRSEALWKLLEESGFTLLGVPEDKGGSGGTLAEAAAILRTAAHHAAPVPLAETGFLAGWLLSAAGQQVPAGPLTAAVLGNGSTAEVPYARLARGIAVLRTTPNGVSVGLAGPEHYTISEGVDVAGVPLDRVTFNQDLPLQWTNAVTADEFRLRAGLARAIQMAGAMETIKALVVEYSGVRRQFGVTLSRFQAVQALIATVAAETSAAVAAVEVALAHPNPSTISAARSRAGQAATIVAPTAHQVFGAIGFTQEHRLHHYTRRLWAWRDSFGNERAHDARLGAAVLAAVDSDPWPLIATLPV